jgi:ATP-dependent Clp protease adaptor protein ClpS
MVTRKQVGPEGGAALAPEQSRTKPPPMFKVLLLNDDFTPMDFVVVVLEKFFGLSREQSTQVMLKVHREGKVPVACIPRTSRRQRLSR